METDTWYALFRLAASFGLTPNEVLSLNLGQLQAYIDGKSDEYERQQALCIIAASWNRNYVMGKKPKSPEYYITRLHNARMKQENSESGKPKEQDSDKLEQEIERMKKLDAQFFNKS